MKRTNAVKHPTSKMANDTVKVIYVMKIGMACPYCGEMYYGPVSDLSKEKITCKKCERELKVSEYADIKM